MASDATKQTINQSLIDLKAEVADRTKSVITGVKIPELEDTRIISNTDQLIIETGGGTKRTTMRAFSDFVGTGLATPKEVQDARGNYPQLGDRLDAMDGKIGTNEQNIQNNAQEIQGNKQEITNLKNKQDTLSKEVVDARTDNKNPNKTHDNLKERLDSDYKELSDGIEKINTRLSGVIHNILSYGCKPDDESFDNAPIINTIINSMSNGGTIQIPAGKFYIKSPIILKPHVTLQGMGSPKPDDSVGGSMICLSNEVNDCNMVEAMGGSDNYCYGVTIRNIGIEGHGGALTGIKLSQCSRTLLEKVDVHYCNVGLEITGGMLDTYKDLNLMYNREFNLLIKNTHYTTTQRFYNCYFGQQKPYPNAVPIKIETSSLTDCTFYSCTIESSPNPVIINPNNNVTFDNIFTENVPSSSGSSVFKVGYKDAGDSLNLSHNGTFKIKGGVMWGVVDNYESKTMFDVDFCDGFSVDGLMYRRFGKVIKTSSNTRCIPSFSNCLGENGLVTTDLDQVGDNITVLNCIVRGHEWVNKEGRKNAYELGFFNLLNGWDNFYGGYETMKAYKTSTGVTLQGVIAGGNNKVVMTLPDEFRPKENIILNGNYVNSDTSSWTYFTIIIRNNGNVEFESPSTMRNQAHAFCLNFQAK